MSGGRFERCIRFTLSPAVEGGYVNDKADHGGETNMGVTASTLRAAIARGIVRKDATVRNLTRDESERIFFYLYWLPPRCPEFPLPLDLLLFDAYVNHRPAAAVRLIQAGVGAPQDGVIGPLTIRSANGVESVVAVERYTRARETFMREIVEADPTQARFLRGWLNRVANLRTAALEDLGLAA